MTEWVALSPNQRSEARLNFAEARKLPPEEKKAKWQAYQALSAEERQKLMFRERARISPELLKQHLQQVKTGLPGVAWIRLDGNAQWPSELAVSVPK